VKWYRKAAKQGLARARAQFNLGAMYANGEGVMKSGAAAADWFYKAGLSYLKEGKRDKALHCVEVIKNLPKYGLTVPNLFLADKLMSRIYK
jgi:TPR repeat protein